MWLGGSEVPKAVLGQLFSGVTLGSDDQGVSAKVLIHNPTMYEGMLERTVHQHFSVDGLEFSTLSMSEHFDIVKYAKKQTVDAFLQARCQTVATDRQTQTPVIVRSCKPLCAARHGNSNKLLWLMPGPSLSESRTQRTCQNSCKCPSSRFASWRVTPFACQLVFGSASC